MWIVLYLGTNRNFMQPQPLIELNSSGAAVIAWQLFLQKNGYNVSTADGNFGPQTQAATMAFQTKNGLTADGVVGPGTYTVAEQQGFTGTAVQMADFVGIDVAHYDSNDGANPINWELVKQDPQNIKFVFVKATDGASGPNSVDQTFATNVAGAGAVGLPVGAYHFYELGSAATAQASNFITNTGNHQLLTLPPVLDFELPVAASAIQQTMDDINTWLEQVEKAFGKTPIIYTNPNAWDALGNPSGFSKYPLWIADYNSSIAPPVLGSWPQWAFWQFTETGTVQGIVNPASMDINHYNPASGILAV
ncbi:Lyzozyme M1 (1,4-beta-N-acetylmuramidase), GH25 family [Sediminibacterium ginsengisoli]|uniref:Lyzozyme M1 (1,4-beta-N-acetylmuramidase), GH25 family n=2 Tax=Sediminibacterium ginsengisoli TaxID=413434 RepID=A0A1T4LF20_9BACT|nr:Lyzozyme M1 (1,4-beta-N-acetylmuramidase), GH25 family [Sediminibacterium ginsengisoli]